ncbi:hypothetical protein [Pseudomonas migulae]|uniref:HNH endonuclease n=1 Tax=Pseudomonas migulae TaxID=78543 RepID=A0ABY8N003_9PSED|nr:hypothetical protein [Pseudomonas migulae]WGK92578.1 hypothetical protein MOQ58_10465 [Pseudomonas migulae]
MRAPQTLCPYTNQPLASIDRINEEHVLPVAVGAPTKFFVMASELENSRLNDLIDAPFSNDPLIRFLAMSQSVVSRSGPVISHLPATLTASGEAVKLAFSQDGIDLRFANPVVTDSETKRVTAVKGFGDAANEHAQRIKKDYAKKKIAVEIGETISTLNPEVQTSLCCDTDLVGKELLKIAYLMTVWCFGDRAIDSESGAIYRRGLATKRSEDFGSIGMRANTNEVPGFSCKREPGTHVLLSAVLGRDLITSITLFGTFAAVFATPAAGIHIEEGQGLSIKINLSTGALTQTTAIEAILANAQRLYGFHP